MSATHCPTCKESLHLWPSFNGGTCLFCINPHCSDNTEHPRLSPTSAQQSQSESIAAPAEVGQGLGTITFKELLPALTEFGIAALYGYALGLALVLWTLKEVGA